MDQQRKPGCSFWTTVALLVLFIAYPLSVGPAIWLSRWLGTESFLVIYFPIGWAASNCRPVGYALALYLHLWGIGMD